MTEVYYPFQAGAGTSVTALQWSRMARLFAADGIPPGTAPVTLGSGLTFNVPVGFAALVRGFYYGVDSTPLTKTGAANVNTSPRVDRLVLRLVYASSSVVAVIKQGTPGSSPTAPTLTQVAGDTWEIGVAQATCPGSASAQNYSNLVLEPTWTDIGAWVSYTPIWTPASAGTGFAQQAKYKRLASGLIHVEASLVAGTGSPSFGPFDLTCSLPVPVKPLTNMGTFLGNGILRPAGGAWFPLHVLMESDRAYLYAVTQSTGHLAPPGSIHSFSAGSGISFSGVYEPA